MFAFYQIGITATIAFLYLSADCLDIGSEIIGGKDVKPNSKPWMASIQIGNFHICGGVLIKDQWVLTAAHCSWSFKDEETVVLGAHNLKKEEKSQERLKIEKTVKYPEFDKHPKLNDLMLIKLKTKVKLNKKIKTLSLPKSGKDIKAGVKCKVSGWGKTVNNAHEGSDTLKEADVAVIDRKVCNKYYNGNPNITKDMLCAGDKKGKKDACTGDSGGPLICKNAFTAIVSGGNNCGDPEKPGVYTFLSDKYLPWISKTIQANANITK
ncbi:granzyme K-like [Huso huso]|uniref:Granzyme K-like n=2 Tax=Huso huso TaxID=61971 RepID=A0ABR1ABJ1_HUSHU